MRCAEWNEPLEPCLLVSITRGLGGGHMYKTAFGSAGQGWRTENTLWFTGKYDNLAFRGKTLIGIQIHYFKTSSRKESGVSNKLKKFIMLTCTWLVSRHGRSVKQRHTCVTTLMVTTTPVAAAEGLIALGAWPMSSGWWKGSINSFKSLLSGHSVLNHSTPLLWHARTQKKMSPQLEKKWRIN